MRPQTDPEISARRVALDAEIRCLHERLALLKRERNTLAPLSTLPNELLVKIFHFYVLATAADFRAKGTVISVCRHWCQVFRAAPTLWSHIVMYWNPEQSFPLEISRSGAMPLTIRVPNFSSTSHSSLILPHVARIQSLDLRGPRQVLDFVQSMAALAFPLLESLTINFYDYTVGNEEEIDARLSLERLDERLPRLSELSLFGIYANWASLPPLHSLSLTRSLRSGAILNPITLDDLLAVLESSPALHYLYLCAILTGAIPEKHAPIPVQSLGHLDLRENLVYCQYLLTVLAFPPSTRLTLHSPNILNGADIRAILIPIHRHLRAPGAPRATTVMLRTRDDFHDPEEEDTYFQIAVYAGPPPPKGDEGHLFVIRTNPTSAHALRQILCKVLKALPTEMVSHLDGRNARLSCKTWSTALALLPVLEHGRGHVSAIEEHFQQSSLQPGHRLTMDCYINGEGKLAVAVVI
ncbi:hypothetical protein B0H16DRAFT_1523103 [Mycena metata]|uniref:F-box domain-containing protein n=1 Tax=Mycena metata TaxID=1033252 RepID=A0AAD7NKY3_9AGAR|nr:hypothetical protein B0H16DRAFT_1523103 [Mycena metata]